MEEWRIIEGFSSRYGKPYHVSSLGRIRNPYGKILSFHPHYKGYQMVELPRNGKAGRFQVHRLVANAFLPNPQGVPQVNHKDGDKSNNAVSNLEWVSNTQNRLHAIIHGLCPAKWYGPRMTPKPKATGTGRSGYKCNPKRPSRDEIIEIRNAVLNKNLTRKMLAEKYSLSVYVIKDIRSGSSWRQVT